MWSAAALPGEEIRYAFIANPAGTAVVQTASGGAVAVGAAAFGVLGALAASHSKSNRTAPARTGSEHFPMAPTVVIVVGSHRLRVWHGSKKGKADQLEGEVSYPAIANVQLKEVKAKASDRHPSAGELTLTFADNSRVCFETDCDVARNFSNMVLSVMGGTNAVREESYGQRRAVAQLQNRVAALRAGA